MRSTTFRRFSRRSEGRSTAEADFIAFNFRLDPIRYFKPEHAKLPQFGGQFPDGRRGCCLMVSLRSNHFC
jgi:hypothetical protein